MLTELKIKNLKPQSKSYHISDGGGLCLNVSKSGGKSWRWRYYFLGKPQTLTIGKYPAVSLREARLKRDEARATLESGKHPAREKKAEKLRNALANQNTFKHVAEHWIASRKPAIVNKTWTQNTLRLQQHLFPSLGHLPIAEITIPDVVRVVEKIGERGTYDMAKRVKQLMSQVFRYAAHRGLCIHNPAADLRGILPTTTEEKHFACIHPSELPDLLRAVEKRDNDMTKSAMQLLALTFVRTGELIAAEWSEINWEKKEWHISKARMKMRRPHVVPLSTQAITVLQELHEQTGQRTHIFYSAASKHKHLSNGAILMALRRMGYQGKMTGHGFRTLASTILNEKGYTPDVIERQLAHAENNKIRAAYNRAEYLPERKKMMQDYADLLDQALLEEPPKVIRLKS